MYKFRELVNFGMNVNLAKANCFRQKMAQQPVETSIISIGLEYRKTATFLGVLPSSIASRSFPQELMEEFREDWEPAVEALNEAEPR